MFFRPHHGGRSTILSFTAIFPPKTHHCTSTVKSFTGSIVADPITFKLLKKNTDVKLTNWFEAAVHKPVCKFEQKVIFIYGGTDQMCVLSK